jgi:mRNA interferase MazF
MFKGAIVLVPFPFTDLSGHKVRPALVLHAKSRGEDCIVGFISSVQKKEGALDLLVEASKSNGLKVNSVVKVEKIATLQKKIVIGELGILEPIYMKEIDKKLKTLFVL